MESSGRKHKNDGMLVQTLQLLFHRDINKLRQEIDLYQDEKKIWYTEKEITNSAGNLCLHLIGNLNTYIGAELGKTGYIRNRDLEFSTKGMSKKELLEKIDDTIHAVKNTLASLPEDQLKEEYPIMVFTEKTSTEYLLVHIVAHLSYHLGQINYHRRLLDKEVGISK